jgi:hypothetical protein
MIAMNKLKRFAAVSVCSLIAIGTFASVPAQAASTDLVPTGSSLIDSFAKLADSGYLGSVYSARDFYTNQRYTRGELAQILNSNLLSDSAELAKAESSPKTAPSVVSAIESLRTELKADGVDVNALITGLPKTGNSIVGYIQPEFRGEDGKPVVSDPKTLLVYRAEASGIISKNSDYVISSSNFTQDSRNLFTNDTSVDDNQGLNEAYVHFQGGRGLNINVGRMYNNWGPEYLGAPLLSDNAPALDQLNVSFPFSLGWLGRNYEYTQFDSTFAEDGVQKYFLARRINLQLNSHWNAEYQEAIKSSDSGALWLTPLPFAFKSTDWAKLPGHLGSTNPDTNLVIQLGGGYQFNPQNRLYAQFLIDDLKTPFSSEEKIVPRKIGYVVGASIHPLPSTGVTLEYGYTDPTTYTFNSSDAVWENGAQNYLGSPYGPNSRDYYVRIDQKLGNNLTLTLDGRKHDRPSDSFPQPSSEDEQVAATYSLNKTNWVGLSFEDYSQNPFPFQPGSAGYPTPNNYLPDQTVQGNYIRLQEVDISYGFAL